MASAICFFFFLAAICLDSSISPEPRDTNTLSRQVGWLCALCSLESSLVVVVWIDGCSCHGEHLASPPPTAGQTAEPF